MWARSARALAAAAFASPSDAASSGLPSWAKSSPLRTAWPAWTATEVRRPVISGAMRISVWRTMPASDGGAAACRGTRTANATAASASAPARPTMRRRLRCASIRSPFSDEKPGGQDGEQAVERGERPQDDPVPENVAQRSAHLVDAHQAVDRRRAGKDEARHPERAGDRLDRPRHADEEEQGQARGEEKQDRRLTPLEPRADELTEEADGQHERNEQGEEIAEALGGGKAVDARQHDEEQHGPGKGQQEVGETLPQDGKRGAAAAANALPVLLEGGTAQHRRAHEHGLLQDQHEGGRHDIARITAGGIEQRLVQDLDGRASYQRGAIQAAVGARIARQKVSCDRARALENALKHPIVEQEIGRIDVGRQARPATGEDLAFGTRRNVEDGEDLAVLELGLRLGERCRPLGDADRLVSVQALNEPPAQLRGIVVDDGDGYGADKLSQIRLRVEHAVDERC